MSRRSVLDRHKHFWTIFEPLRFDSTIVTESPGCGCRLPVAGKRLPSNGTQITAVCKLLMAEETGSRWAMKTDESINNYPSCHETSVYRLRHYIARQTRGSRQPNSLLRSILPDRPSVRRAKLWPGVNCVSALMSDVAGRTDGLTTSTFDFLLLDVSNTRVQCRRRQPSLRGN